MIGLVTIGQAPRNDIAASMFGEQRSAHIIQTGALDLLDWNQIRELAPRPDESVLVSRLVDGTEVMLAKQRLTPHLQLAVDRAEQAGADIVCVLCTGEFTGLYARKRLVFPDRLLRSVIDAMLPDGTLGVLIPHSDQESSMIEKWSMQDRKPVVAVASPYSETASIGEASARLASAGADMIVMDCMGFTRQMREAARARAQAPVILSNSLVGAVLEETMLSVGRAEQVA